MRTQVEIAEKMKGDKGFLNFENEVLLDCLDFEHAKPHLKDGVTADEWDKREHGVYGGQPQYGSLLTEERVRQAALDYLKFAWGKAEDHRGISASRSVDKMTAYCWILGLDVSKIEEAGYAQYGCPKLKAASELLGAPLPTEPTLVRMMNGEACGSTYECGCGT